MPIRAIPEELKRLYQQGRLIPFVGAGISHEVTWNQDGVSKHGLSWQELVNGALEMLGFKNPELLRVRGTDLQILEYFKIKKNGLAALTNWLYSEMKPPDEALKDSVIHRRLAGLKKCHIVYTTNFDDFLERSFPLQGRGCNVVAIEAHMGANTDNCEIVKFHGDFNHPERMVLSESDYERRLTFTSPMDLRLRSDMLGRAMLFLGYSFRDPNVAYLFRLVNEQLNTLPGSMTGHRAYIIVPDPSDFEHQLFNARNIQVIPVDGGSITEEIDRALAELEG
jgi:hypothetical protein